jgi:hypothetical protein
VLFSQPELAQLVSQRFEPAWTTLRPAPQVTIDFGGGRVVRRTLHGNVLTWICDPQGRALDAVPGVCTPEVYRARLDEALALYAQFAAKPERERNAAFRAWHAERSRPNASMLADFDPELFLAKRAIEAPVERAITAAPLVSNAARVDFAAKREIELPVEVALQPASLRAALDADTELNETVRRRKVHQVLAASGLVPPAQLTKRVFLDVLGVDLDDPYLGLSQALFETYPFAH